MSITNSNSPTTNTLLEQTLARGYVWRGFKPVIGDAQSVDSTGFTELDDKLRANGWPEDGLIDIALHHYGSEWLLWLPWLQRQMQSGHTVALLNPPWLPYAISLVQAGLSLDQLLIVTPQNPAEWLASWRDIVQAKICNGVLAWAQMLSYPELRKCHLLASETRGVYAVHRPWLSQRQSSPAVLRIGLRWQQDRLRCELLKQKGCLAGDGVFLQPATDIAGLWQEFARKTSVCKRSIASKPLASSVSLHPAKGVPR